MRPGALAVWLVGAVLLGSGLTGCGSDSAAAPPRPDGLQGLILRPAKPAPALALRNYTGGRVTLAAQRGKAVFVTFVYTHCPDVCPLIVSSLADAQRRLGPAAPQRMRIIAVTVDPGRDTPSAVRAFLAARDATGRMDYLLGSGSQLRRTWKAWDVGVTLGRNHLTTGHSSVIYGISASGKMAVVYNSDVSPEQIDHDVPLLRRS